MLDLIRIGRAGSSVGNQVLCTLEPCLSCVFKNLNEASLVIQELIRFIDGLEHLLVIFVLSFPLALLFFSEGRSLLIKFVHELLSEVLMLLLVLSLQIFFLLSNLLLFHLKFLAPVVLF